MKTALNLITDLIDPPWNAKGGIPLKKAEDTAAKRNLQKLIGVIEMIAAGAMYFLTLALTMGSVLSLIFGMVTIANPATGITLLLGSIICAGLAVGMSYGCGLLMHDGKSRFKAQTI